jgi:hypothetical protein
VALDLEKDFDEAHNKKVIKAFLNHSLCLGETLYYYNTVIDINGNNLGKLFRVNEDYWTAFKGSKVYRIKYYSIGEIYKIENIINNKIYIGESVNIFTRKNTHVHNLYSGCHSNSLMQYDFYMYGISAFTFEIIEQVKRDGDLFLREKYWIKEYESEYPNGYNMPKNRKEYSQSEAKLFMDKYSKLNKNEQKLMVEELKKHRGNKR